MASLRHIGSNIGTDEVFSPDHSILIIIQRAIKNHQDVKIMIDTGEYILVLSSTAEYVDKTHDLETFCQQKLSAFHVKLLTKEQSQQQYDTSRCLDELMWSACFYLSNGRLLTGCYRDDVVELVRWPNLTRIPRTPNTMRLASLFYSHPTSLMLAQRSLLKIDTKEAYQFYSSARFAGYAKAINRPKEALEELKDLKPHRNRTILGLLLKKFTGKMMQI